MKQSKIITCIFATLLFAMTLLSIFLPDRTYSPSEKRMLESMPALTLDSLLTRDQEKKFTQKYENYVADQFLLRDTFVSGKSLTERLLGKRDIGGIYLGEDNYLFSKETEIDIARLKQNLSCVQLFFNELRNIPSVQNSAFTLIPDSSHILSDKLPSFAQIYDFQSVQAVCLSNPELNYVDTYATLTEHNTEYIYYRNDHHWTTLGAYYGYTALSNTLKYTPNSYGSYSLEEVSNDFKGTYASKTKLPVVYDTITKHEPLGALSITMEMPQNTVNTLYDDSALKGEDKYNYFLFGNQSYNRIQTGIKNGRHLLVVKDSYAHSLIPFLCSHYESVLAIDLRHNRDSALELCRENGITDVLILYQATNFSKDSSVLQLTLK